MGKDEDVVVKTKKLYKGLTKYSPWFADFMKRGSAGIEDDGKSIWMMIDDAYLVSIEPSDDGRTVGLHVTVSETGDDVADNTFDFHSYDELGDRIHEFLAVMYCNLDYYYQQRAGE